jgi:hypothetical protein
MSEIKKTTKNENKSTYTVEDALKIADDIFKMGKEKKYSIGAFVHGLLFAQEYIINTYKIPQQQIATIKRDCRKYFRVSDSARKK